MTRCARIAVASSLLLLSASCRQILGVEERRPEDAPPTPPPDTFEPFDLHEPPPTCEADIETDRHNCGACGHDCLGGECDAGECQPYQVSSTPTPKDNTGVLFDDNPKGFVYWWRYRFDGAIYRAPKAGGDATEVIRAPDAGWIRQVVTDGQRLYFTNYSDWDQIPSRGVYSCAMDGTDAQQLSSGYGGPSFLAVDDTYVYFNNAFDDVIVARVPKTGGDVEALFTYTPGAGDDNGYPLYREGNWVYFSGSKLPITRMKTDGSAVAPVFGIQKGVIEGVHAGMLYWTDPQTTVLGRGPADGSALPDTFFVEAQGALSFQNGWIYGHRGSAVVRFREDEAAPSVEFVAFGSSPAPSADPVSVWWVEHVTGELFRLAL